MSNVLDYLTWRGDLNLAQAEWNDVDNLALCCLAYVDFEGIVDARMEASPLSIQQAAERFFAKPPGERRSRVPEDQKLLRAMAESRRYGSWELNYYVNKIDVDEQTQFSAITVLPGDGTVFVAYRGTDNTLVGWKEDFNLSFLSAIPAQRIATSYLERVAHTSPGSLRVGGHSKGGNLAVYAAAHCKERVQGRIVSVYNNDGPGFNELMMDTDGYRAVLAKIRTFVPQSSIVGMLLEHEEEYTVIHSTQTGVMQHDPYSWEVLGPRFVHLDSVTRGSQFVDQTLKAWVATMDIDQRGRFFDTLYNVLQATRAQSLDELTAGWFKNAKAIVQSFHSLDEDSKQLIFQILSLLVDAAKRNLYLMRPEKLNSQQKRVQ